MESYFLAETLKYAVRWESATLVAVRRGFQYKWSRPASVMGQRSAPTPPPPNRARSHTLVMRPIFQLLTCLALVFVSRARPC
jgi:hypothetical protein